MVDASSQRLAIPPLENGDRLNRFEFERRYNTMPHIKKAELIAKATNACPSTAFALA